jgi:sensor histidine kinase YesM
VNPKKNIERLNDLWMRIIGIPMVSLAATFTFSANMWMEDHSLFWKTFFVSVVNAVFTWETCRVILIRVRKRYPGIEQTSKRIFFSLLFYLPACIIVTGIILFALEITRFWSYHLGWYDWIKNIFICYSFVMLIAFIYEAVYYYHRWSRAIVETEDLKKTGMQCQLDSLKNQISPHFLFNSLNVLSSLVEENFSHAEHYVRELSRVYHYVLESNRTQLTTLSSELEFINAYVFLLRTRFGENLKLQTEVSPGMLQRLIPPLALQMLVENAVKHNIVSSSKPLYITIKSLETGMLSVSNNLQKKTTLINSNHVGLKNIRTRYSMLVKREMIVAESEFDFKVTVPLLREEEIPQSFIDDYKKEIAYAV